MRIVLATPLYPPEIAPAAVYSKELVRRLAVAGHTVTVLAYTHLPEQVQGVTVIVIDKHKPRLARLRAFRKTLAKTVNKSDAVIVINGLSTEVPILFTSLPRTILCIGDKTAHKRFRFIKWLTEFRVHSVVNDVPNQKPEILPLEPKPVVKLRNWEESWNDHLQKIESILHHEN